jgi:hypothetical protein
MRIYLNIAEKRLSQEIEKGYKWFNMKNLKKTRLVVWSIYVDLYEAVVQTWLKGKIPQKLLCREKQLGGFLPSSLRRSGLHKLLDGFKIKQILINPFHMVLRC